MSAIPVPMLPETAPFTPAQRAWLNGFFAGLVSLDGAGVIALSPEQSATLMTITTIMMGRRSAMLISHINYYRGDRTNRNAVASFRSRVPG